MTSRTKDKIPIVELFGPTIQGEGALCGQVSYFLRTGGCSWNCTWCDSMHAVDPKEVRKRAENLSAVEIIDRIGRLASSTRKHAWVTLTGGDPVLWDMEKVVLGLRLSGFRVAVETQGFLWKDWLEHCDLVTASPKPPSSGMADRFRIDRLQKYAVRMGSRIVMKIVCFDDVDLDWAAKLHDRFPKIRFYLSSGTPVDDADPTAAILGGYRRLTEAVLGRSMLHDATVLPQVHALLWPGVKMGR